LGGGWAGVISAARPAAFMIFKQSKVLELTLFAITKSLDRWVRPTGQICLPHLLKFFTRYLSVFYGTLLVGHFIDDNFLQ